MVDLVCIKNFVLFFISFELFLCDLFFFNSEFSLDFYSDLHDMQRLASIVKEPEIQSESSWRIENEQGLSLFTSSTSLKDKISIATEARSKAFKSRYKKLHASLAEVVTDFNLLSFVPVSIKEPDSLLRVIKVIDKSNGYVPLSKGIRVGSTIPSEDITLGTLSDLEYEKLSAFEEKYLSPYEQEKESNTLEKINTFDDEEEE